MKHQQKMAIVSPLFAALSKSTHWEPNPCCVVVLESLHRFSAAVPGTGSRGPSHSSSLPPSYLFSRFSSHVAHVPDPHASTAPPTSPYGPRRLIRCLFKEGPPPLSVSYPLSLHLISSPLVFMWQPSLNSTLLLFSSLQTSRIQSRLLKTLKKTASKLCWVLFFSLSPLHLIDQ